MRIVTITLLATACVSTNNPPLGELEEDATGSIFEASCEGKSDVDGQYCIVHSRTLAFKVYADSSRFDRVICGELYGPVARVQFEGKSFDFSESDQMAGLTRKGSYEKVPVEDALRLMDGRHTLHIDPSCHTHDIIIVSMRESISGLSQAISDARYMLANAQTH